MKPLKKNTAIKAWLALMLFWMAGVSWAAQVAGTVVQLSGPLMARKADGAMRILAMRSEVESGDTLMTEKNTYAMVKFIDNSEITLKPSTTFKVENFSYDENKPDGDKASFNLVKGGLRSVTGLLGKRNKEKFEMKTPSATIGIRGTTFVAEWVEPSATAIAAREAYLMASTASLDSQAMPVQPLLLAQAAAPTTPELPPGLYTYVIQGGVLVSNNSGSTSFGPEQWGFAPPNQGVPPIVLPKNPGMSFTTSPMFNQPQSSTNNPPAAAAEDSGCVMR